MSEHGVVEMVLATHRMAVLKRVLFGLTLGAGLLYWFYHRDPVWFPMSAGVAVLIFAYALHLPVRLLISGEAILIADRGLVDRTSGLDFIGWQEIRSAHLESFMGLTLVGLDLTDPQEVVGRLSPLRRWVWRSHLQKQGARPTLAGSFVEGGPEALQKLINERARGARTDSERPGA
jgi:hypothetical protein